MSIVVAVEWGNLIKLFLIFGLREEIEELMNEGLGLLIYVFTKIIKWIIGEIYNIRRIWIEIFGIEIILRKIGEIWFVLINLLN